MNRLELQNMINEYNDKLGNIEPCVLLVKPEIYEALKDELDQLFIHRVVICNMLPKNTNAILMSKKQYDDLYYGAI